LREPAAAPPLAGAIHTSRGGPAARSLLRTRHAALAGLLLAVIAGAALFAPLLPYGPYHQDVHTRNVGPSGQHWLGTDQLGRDIFARLAFGARVSSIVALASTMITLSIGIVVGSIAGYLGGRVDAVMMRVVDAMYAFPDLLFAILLSALIKGNLTGTVSGPLGALASVYQSTGGLLGVLLTIGLTSWLTVCRLVRGQILTLKHAEYVDAARCAGASGLSIVRSHLLPNAVAPILVAATLAIPNAVILEAGLSFIGLGVDPPTPSWGTMIADGVNSLESYPYQLWIPAAAIGLALLCLNILGDSVRDALDPLMRRRRWLSS
jgi:ABC-type dipeptide/oligopeptide/nickel transport system permease subunit